MKDKILKLIDAYIQDDEAINGEAKVVLTPSGYGHVHSFEGVFIMNSKNTQKPNVTSRIFHDGHFWNNTKNLYSFDAPKLESKAYDYYNMTFSFENQPPIQILNRSTNLIVEHEVWAKKKNSLLGKHIKLIYQFSTTDKPQHFIKCGSFEFDISDEQVAEIYNKIENRRLEIKKSIELAELNKRFEKYGIQ